MVSSGQRIYLDYNAASPLRPSAAVAMAPYLTVWNCNPSSPHAEGRDARQGLERGRRQVAEAIGARGSEVILTGSATEANNLALKGLAAGEGGRPLRIVVGAGAHPSVLGPARWLADRGDAELQVLPVDATGTMQPGALRAVLDGRRTLVSVIAANNETGGLADVEEIAAIARRHEAIVHVDAAQACGRLPVRVDAWDADLITLSSHKVGGPRGVGALYCRTGVALEPLIHGGHHERDRRAGTEDVAAIVGFGAVLAEATAHLSGEVRRLAALRDRLWRGISQRIPDVHRNGDPERCLPNTLNVSFGGTRGETVLIGLDLEGVAASSGSACTSGSLEPSHVLLAMGLGEARARSAVRFSVGHRTKEEEIERVVEILPAVIERARQETP